MTLRLKYHRSQFKGRENTNLKELKPSNRSVSWRHRSAEAEALNSAVWSLQTCSLNGRDLLSELGVLPQHSSSPASGAQHLSFQNQAQLWHENMGTAP